MLVVKRYADQRIVIREDIVLTVVAIQGSQGTLGIEAPESVKIWREELADKGASDTVTAHPAARMHSRG